MPKEENTRIENREVSPSFCKPLRTAKRTGHIRNPLKENEQAALILIQIQQESQKILEEEIRNTWVEYLELRKTPVCLHTPQTTKNTRTL
jgi:hypothetical protein